MSADISSNSCAKKNIDLCFIELLKEKKEGDKKWFQENQIRKKKELEDFFEELNVNSKLLIDKNLK